MLERNPVLALDHIMAEYQRYLDTAFHFKSESLAEERREHLRSWVMSEVQVEPVAIHRAHERTLNEMVENGVMSLEFMEFFTTGLMPYLGGADRLHTHQARMLNPEGHPHRVVTSGTGSGKTESFLLPILQHLEQELATAADAGPAPADDSFEWWNSDARRYARQYPQQGRTAGLRALILYPMNALVEDQLRRLRMALDCREMHELYNSRYNGHRPRIGRYNSATLGGTKDFRHHTPNCGRDDGLPIGPHAAAREHEVASKLHDMQETWDSVLQLHENDARLVYLSHEHEDGFFFQNPFGIEARTRQDMHHMCPDILVTNQSMLTGMMMREFDEPIIEQTRTYLATDGAVFHLVLDELHLHRGAAGTEVALQIRLLLDRLGLINPDGGLDDRLRVLCSSASLNDGEGREFLRDFFSFEDNVDIISGEWADVGGAHPETERLAQPEPRIPIGLLTNIAAHIDDASASDCGCSGRAELSTDCAHVQHIFNELQAAFGMNGPVDIEAIGAAVFDHDGACPWDATVLAASQNENDGTLGTLPWRSLLEAFCNGATTEEEAWRGLRGLLWLRDVRNRSPSNEKPKLRLRFHGMYRNLPGLAALPASHDDPFRNVGPITQLGDDPWPQLDPEDAESPRIKRLELLYCDECGETLFGGLRSVLWSRDGSEAFQLLDSEPNPDVPNEQLLPKRVEEQNYLEYAVFWPTRNADLRPQSIRMINGAVAQLNDLYNAPQTGHLTHPKLNPHPSMGWAMRGWKEAWLNPHTGCIYTLEHEAQRSIEGITDALQPVRGWLVHVPMIDVNFPATGRGVETPSTRNLQSYQNQPPTPESVQPHMSNEGHKPLLRSLQAMPTDCPSCGRDRVSTAINNQRHAEDRKPSRTSPIRSFRTGFGEMSYQLTRSLTDTLSADVSRKKLIAFNDSRANAADLSKRINDRHRENAVYEVAMNILRRIAVEEPEWVQHEGEGFDLDQHQRQRLDEVLDDDEHRDTILGRGGRRIAPLELLLVANGANDDDVTVSAPHYIPGRRFAHASWLEHELAEMGVDPSGEGQLTHNRGQEDERQLHWREVYDCNVAREPHQRLRYQREYAELQPRIQRNLNATLLTTMLWRPRSELQTMGLGRITTLRPLHRPDGEDGMSDAMVQELVDAVLRLFGIERRYHDPRAFEQRRLTSLHAFRKSILPFVRSVFEHQRLRWNNQPGEAGADAFLTWLLCDQEGGGTGVLHEDCGNGDFGPIRHEVPAVGTSRPAEPYLIPEHLAVYIAPEAERVVRCQVCNFSHLESSVEHSQTCQRCFAMFDGNERYIEGDAVRDRFQVSNRLASPDLDVSALRAGEMTGQTDDQFERQRRFRNIILRHDIEDPLEVLSVTTTTEVGIDMGSLNAIFLANMPPERFNYQQRVGRAGRRHEAYSLAVTFCRDSSHDAHHFVDPREMTGGECPQPRLNMEQPRFAQRVFAKEVLRRALLPYRRGLTADTESDIHGEFGSVSMFDPHVRGYVDAFLDNEENGNILRHIAMVLWQNHGGEAWTVNELVASVTEADDGLLTRMDAALTAELPEKGLGEALADQGVLPMYGMPTAVRVFHHQDKRLGTQSIGEVDRPLDFSISEFSPGRSITKDGFHHLAVGITPPLRMPNYGQNISANDVHAYSRVGRIWLDDHTGVMVGEEERLDLPAGPLDPPDPNPAPERDSPSTGRALQAMRYVVPRAFTSDWYANSNERVGGVSSLTRLHYPAHNDGHHIEGSNIVFHSTQSTEVLVLNLGPQRNGFELVGVENRRVSIGGAGFFARNQLLAIETRNMAHRSLRHLMEGDPLVTAALAAPKTTDVLRLHAQCTPRGVNLDMHGTRSGNAGTYGPSMLIGLKAAYTSAHVMLRSEYAHLADIDPLEIESCHPQRAVLDDGTTASIMVMNDRAANGSGFVVDMGLRLENRTLMEGLLDAQRGSRWSQEVVGVDHRTSCRSSCRSCLRMASNHREHGLLDWQLGMALLRVLHLGWDVGASATSATELATTLGRHTETANWMAQTIGDVRLLSTMFSSRTVVHPAIDDGPALPVLLVNRRGATSPRALVFVHPLWTNPDLEEIRGIPTRRPEHGVVDQTMAWLRRVQNVERRDVHFVSSFDAHHRPAFIVSCFQGE